LDKKKKKKKVPESLPNTHIKKNSKEIKQITHRLKGKKRGANLCDLWWGHVFLDKTSKAQATKEKNR
jgi:hypothetical protein